jgi:hypothetical protein
MEIIDSKRRLDTIDSECPQKKRNWNDKSVVIKNSSITVDLILSAK